MVNLNELKEGQTVYYFDDYFFEILICTVMKDESVNPPYTLWHGNTSATGAFLLSRVERLYISEEEAKKAFYEELERWRRKIKYWKYQDLYLCDDCNEEYVVHNRKKLLSNFCPYCGSKDISIRVPLSIDP